MSNCYMNHALIKLGMGIDACESVAELTEATRILDTLTFYSAHKSRAVDYRLAGNITQAQRFEALAQNEYQKLPHAARW